jgi:ethanolamine permease
VSSAGEPQLRKALGPVSLWGLGVGYVISGMYFGWNLGLPVAGPFAFLGATLLVTILYVCFVLSYAELSCALPRAGGAFAYAERAFGPTLAFLTGLAQVIEFAFAPPAIAAGIGAHVNLLFPGVPVLLAAFAVYVVCTALNAWGVQQSAVFELVVTALAVAGLLLFAGLALPRFTWAAFARDPVAHGRGAAFAALPYAIWFYLAIEGLANVAEETAHPQRDLPRGFGSAMATLVALALLTLMAAVGVAGWPTVVYPPGSSSPSDSPLPLALGPVTGAAHPLYRAVVVVGVCGLLASFHGILLAGGRALFELGRMGYAPSALGRLLRRRGTPAVALAVNMIVGMIALCTGRTGDLITVSVFGALAMYALAMGALFALRRRRPALPRPFRVPLYPWTPALALALSLLCLVAVAYYAPGLALAFLAAVAAGYAWFWWAVRTHLLAQRT